MADMTGTASTGLHLSDCRSFLAAFFSKCRPSLIVEVMQRRGGGGGGGGAARPVKPEDYAAFLDGLADVLLEALVRSWSMFMTGDMDHRTTFALLMTSKDGVRRVAARKAPLAIIVLSRDAAKVSHRAPPLGPRIDAGCFRVRWEVDDRDEPEHNPCAWLHVPMTMADLARRLSPAQRSRVAELCRDDSPFVVLSDVVPLIRECRSICCTSSSSSSSGSSSSSEVTDRAALRVIGETHIAALQCCITCGAPRGPKAVRKCEGCRRATYCSRECQLGDWKAGHKSVCGGGAGQMTPRGGAPPPRSLV